LIDYLTIILKIQTRVVRYVISKILISIRKCWKNRNQSQENYRDYSNTRTISQSEELSKSVLSKPSPKKNLKNKFSKSKRTVGKKHRMVTIPKQEPKITKEERKKLEVEKGIKSGLDEKELEKIYNKERYKIRNQNGSQGAVIDWKNTQLYENIIHDRVKEFNYTGDTTYFTDIELDHVLQMIQEKGITETELIKPFYMKSSLTLFKLIEY